MEEKGEGEALITVSLDTLIFVLRCTETIRKKYGYWNGNRYVINTNIFMYGYVNRYGFIFPEGTEIWTGYGLFLAQGST